jgi:hypothetical protein
MARFGSGRPRRPRGRRREARDGVEQVVIPGSDHDDRDEQRIENTEPHDGVVGVLDELPAAPQRPRNVQGRHRRELVREPAETAWRGRVGPPPADTGKTGHRVDESRQHPLRRDWHCREDGKATIVVSSSTVRARG